MTAYYMDEGAFELPPGLKYVDRSVNVLEVPGPDGVALGFTAERRPIPDGKSLLDVVTEIRREEALKLRGHTPLHEGETRVDGLTCLETQLRWRHAKGPVFHFQVHIPVDGICVTLCASSKFDRMDECTAWMTALLNTFRFRPR